MKLLKYIDDGNRALVAILFDDNTYAETTVISKNRDKQDILKDAYIISKNKEKFTFEGNKDEYEDLVLEAPKPNTLDVNFYELSGKVYDQYGNEIQAEITFSVEGTDKAKIENGKLVEEDVEEMTPYFIVAKCSELQQKEEKIIYPVNKRTNTELDLEKRLEATEKAVADMIMIVGGIE